MERGKRGVRGIVHSGVLAFIETQEPVSISELINEVGLMWGGPHVLHALLQRLDH